MRKSKVVVGTIWGKWTVIEELPRVDTPSGRQRPKVKVRCACGKESELQSTGLTSGTSTGCRNCAKRAATVGDRFDKLVVQGYEKVRGKSMIACLCDCGNRVMIRIGQLRTNQTNHCGCAHIGSWAGVGELSKTVFNHIRHNAKVRNLEFRITCEEAWALYETQGRICALSGLPLAFDFGSGRNTASLDRKNPSKGYTLDNVQWVHREVNLTKWDFTDDEYITMCRLVTDHQAGLVAQKRNSSHELQEVPATHIPPLAT